MGVESRKRRLDEASRHRALGTGLRLAKVVWFFSDKP